MIEKVPLELDPTIEEAIDGPYRTLLQECVRLHRECYLAPAGPFRYSWFDLGPGYAGHPCFGHWDLVHECINILPFAPEVVRQQIVMYLGFMDDVGHMPGTVWGPRTDPEWGKAFDPDTEYSQDGFRWGKYYSHPPMWPHLVDDYFALTGDVEFLAFCLDRGLANLGWWQTERRAPDGGFFYTDIINRLWESGVDDGVRFINAPTGPRACIDTTCHLTAMMKSLQAWAHELGRADVDLQDEIAACEETIQRKMWDEGTGFFYDSWQVDGSARKVLSFEAFFTLLAGIADHHQAEALLGHLLAEDEFFTYHPVATVAANEPEFKLDCWRGCAWNSMTYWIMRGLAKYGMKGAACAVGHKALERTQEAFDAYGCIFEFYNSVGPDPSVLWRKGQATGPHREYLGHAPLIAMWKMVR